MTESSTPADFGNDPADVAIVGGGILGTALLYVLSRYTNAGRIVLIEKYDAFATVNSHPNNNSQTLHFGDIETNYDINKAREVKAGADMMAGYLERHGEGMYAKDSKMVLAVGADEVRTLTARHAAFQALFPHLRLLGRDEIAAVEPNVVLGRDPHVPLAALYTDEGFAVNFQKLAQSFASRAQDGEAGARIVVRTGVSVRRIMPRSDRHVLVTTRGDIAARVVVFATGPHSLAFAKSVGLGKHLGVVPVAGNFYRARNALRGKVYMMQRVGMPFAAVHGDPNVNDLAETRFGPTIRILPMLERHDYRTFRDFLCTSVWTWRGIRSLLATAFDPKLFRYTIDNVLFDLPFIGTRLFLRKEVRKIVPALRLDNFAMIRGAGGIRPQILNTATGAMEFGEAQLVGERAIFNVTPSPGASMALKQAEKDAQIVIDFLNEAKKSSENKALYRFDREALRADTRRA